MKSSQIEVHYFPSIAYFAALSSADTIILERHEHYVKQSYRNRCHIKNSQGLEVLSVPVSYRNGQDIVDVRIDHNQRWQLKHWRAIQSAYGNAPYFEFYADAICKVLNEKKTFLYDLNHQVLSLCLGFLKWNKRVEETSQYEKCVSNGTNDLRNRITPKNEIETAELFQPISYIQVFGNMFDKNLSILDLIFCTGPDGAGIIKQSSLTK